MIVAQISGTHIALDTPDADQRIRDFERTIVDINALHPAPDVIVHTGDIGVDDPIEAISSRPLNSEAKLFSVRIAATFATSCKRTRKSA
jgi:hypothetical protein